MGCTKSKIPCKQVPWTLASRSRQDWIAWRNCFLTYMHEVNVPVYKQGTKFFEFIGNVGLEIAKNFYYHSEDSATDINTLLFKFDVYFIFGCRRRHADETIDDYVSALKTIAEKTGKSNIEKVLKEKLLQDMKSEKIFERFLEMVPSFSKVTDYESLALHELTFIWHEFERQKNLKQYEISAETKKREAFEDVQPNDRCLDCDRVHQGTGCKAVGEKCWKCGDWNHFARCCFKIYVSDCPNCGTSHPAESKCPAFGKACPMCTRLNHFSWKCHAEIIPECEFCGRSHGNNRQQCPAFDSKCVNCHKIGHFSYKCRSRRNSKSKK